MPRRPRPAVHRLSIAIAAAAILSGGSQAAQIAREMVIVTGTLRSESGPALPYAEVQACSMTLCLYGSSDADGRFRFELPATASAFVIKTPEEVAAQPSRAAALAPILRRASRQPIDMGTVHVPQFSSLRPFPRADPIARVDAGDGMELTLVRSDLTPAAGKSIVTLSARRIPSGQIPAYDLPRGETIVGVYAMHPFGATSRSPMAVRVPSTLAPGTPVRFRTIREIDGSFSEPVPGHATGTHAATAPARGISELTHVVVTRAAVAVPRQALPR